MNKLRTRPTFKLKTAIYFKLDISRKRSKVSKSILALRNFTNKCQLKGSSTARSKEA